MSKPPIIFAGIAPGPTIVVLRAHRSWRDGFVLELNGESTPFSPSAGDNIALYRDPLYGDALAWRIGGVSRVARQRVNRFATDYSAERALEGLSDPSPLLGAQRGLGEGSE